jgi:small subunit ribosomal protein S6
LRDYELVYILDPDISEEALAGLMERFRTLATTQGAEVKSQERWEKRRLAYEIKNKREGTYVVMEFSAPTAAVQELDRILKITDGVLRHLITIAEGPSMPLKPAAAATPAAAETPAAPAEASTEAEPSAPAEPEAATEAEPSTPTEPEPQNPVEGSVEEEDETPEGEEAEGVDAEV